MNSAGHSRTILPTKTLPSSHRFRLEMKDFQINYKLIHPKDFAKKLLIAGSQQGFFLVLVWLFFWLAPWTNWLEPLPWMRLGIGFLLFVIPGMITSILLAGDRFSILRHFIGGIAFSVFFVSILGILGRLFHLPFEFIKFSVALIGFITLVMLLRHPNWSRRLYLPTHPSFSTLFILFFLVAFGIVINLMSRTTGDDQTYLAYLTSWQHASHLSFEEVYFRSGTLDSIRFWFAMFPMSLALLADMSNMHGLLLIGFYLEPFLILIAILAAYDLYKNVLHSRYQALAALVLQFTFLFLLRGSQQPGLTFFSRLSEDKVFGAFILFPVFFSSAYFLLEEINFRSVLYFLLSGFSLALTHPITLAFSTFIIGCYIAITTMLRKEHKKAFVALLSLIVIIFPVGLLRFVEVSSADIIPYDLESALEGGAGIETRISYLKGTPFYGFNVERVKIEMGSNDHPGIGRSILAYSYIWIVGIGFVWSIVNIKKRAVAPFVVATSALVVFSAIPYTGWLIGYFVSARMLWRTPWMIPIGLIGVILIDQCIQFISPKLSSHGLPKFSAEQFTFYLVMATSSLIIAMFSIFVYRNDWQALHELPAYKNTLEKLSALGQYLEVNIDRPSIFLAAPQSSHSLTGLFTQSLMDYLPGLSSKSKVVVFRWFYPPRNIDLEKLNLIFSTDPAISPSQRINVLKRNQVEYILLDNNSIIEYYADQPQFFDIERFENYGIVLIHGT